MARKMSSIEEINDSKETWKLGIRIINLWQVHKPSRPESIEMIFIDKKGDKIQAEVKNLEMEKWKSQLKDGSSYIVQNFQVERNIGQYKTSNHPYKLIFMRGTIVEEHDLPEIPHYVFHFIGFEDIINGRASADVLVDVIGEFAGEVQYRVDNTPKRMSFNMKDQGGSTLNCTLWEEYATQLLSFLEKHESGPIVILLTLAKIKDSKGRYPISIQNNLYGSKLLINDNIEEIQQFKNKLELSHISYESYSQGFTQLSSCSQVAPEDKFFHHAQVKSIFQINELKQESYCVTVAKLDKFFANGWCYEACEKCNKKVDPTTMPYTCGSCGMVNSRTVPRFRLEVKVSHQKENAKFILWDRECFQLIKQTASQLKKQLNDEGELNPMALPEAVDSVLGMMLAFRIKVQPTYKRASVIQLSEDAKIIESIVQQISSHEDTVTGDKGKSICSVQKEDDLYDSQSLSATADFDPDLVGSFTPAKRLSCDSQFDDLALQDLTSGQLSSTKSTKHIKTE